MTEGDKIQRAWAELTTLIRESNTELFESNQRVEDSLLLGYYLEYVQRFNEKLRIWKSRFEQTEGLSSAGHHGVITDIISPCNRTSDDHDGVQLRPYDTLTAF